MVWEMQINPSALLVDDCFGRLNPGVAPIVARGQRQTTGIT